MGGCNLVLTGLPDERDCHPGTLALFAWDLLLPLLPSWDGKTLPRLSRHTILLLVPVLPLAAWYAFHYHETGFIFGNPEFFRYNVQATIQPLRILLALLVRLWQTLGYLHLLILTLAALFAMWLPPLHSKEGERPRIALAVQFAMLSVIVAYVLAMALVGGAEWRATCCQPCLWQFWFVCPRCGAGSICGEA